VNSAATAIWARSDTTLIGAGPALRVDPGTGPGRYRRALQALRDSGKDLAFASFTFDAGEPGSVVEIPESVETSGADQAPFERTWSGRVVSDGEAVWRRGVSRALDAIGSALVEKVVLSRQVDLALDSPVTMRALVDGLRASEPGSHTFHVAGLVGASPELLVSLRRGRVKSVALAGTAAEPDQLDTDKMVREHGLTRASVEDGIGPHVTSLEIHERTVKRFGQIRHLATQFDGQASPGARVLDLVASLHPTAAVAGAPTDAAMKIIDAVEPKTRGRYAGPVGWFDSSGDGEFAIALRCGFLDGLRATLYAGGGIVEGSIVEAELGETELKLQPMLRALGAR